MRNEDDAFAKIIEEEFNERWTPPQPVAPAPDFQLNLYDDDEEYRAVPQSAWSLSGATLLGLALVGIGLVITIVKFAAAALPGWLGWAGVACFAGGTAVALWHLTHLPDSSGDDEEGTV